MNDRTEFALSTLNPVMAITVYKSTMNAVSEGMYYLESHDIGSDGKISAGRPLLQETMQDIVDVFFDERKNMSRIKGLLPDNVLQFELLPGGKTKLIWHRPAEVRVLHHAAQLKLKTAKAWVPALLYVADASGFKIYALKSNARPTEKTKLYQAPFFNVGDNGLVCLGSAQVTKIKEPSYSDILKYWEDLFWLSEFTHVNGGKKVKTGALDVVWRKLINSKEKLKWSDVDELLPTKYTLKNLI